MITAAFALWKRPADTSADKSPASTAAILSRDYNKPRKLFLQQLEKSCGLVYSRRVETTFGGSQGFQIGTEFITNFIVLQGHFYIGLEMADLAAAIVAHAGELVRQYRLLTNQRFNGIGELDFAAGPRRRVIEQTEHARRENIAADHSQVRRCLCGFRFLHDAANFRQPRR